MKPRGFLLQIISFSVASMLTTSIVFPIILQMALLSSAVAEEQRTYPVNPKHEQSMSVGQLNFVGRKLMWKW